MSKAAIKECERLCEALIKQAEQAHAMGRFAESRDRLQQAVGVTRLEKRLKRAMHRRK